MEARLDMSDRHSTIRRIFSGLGMVLGGKLGAGLISLGYLVIAARTLGPNNYGVLVLIHGYVTAVCGIIEFPAWQAILRYGAEAQRDGQRHRLIRLLRFGAFVELTGGLAAIVVAAIAVPIVGPRFGWSPEVMTLAVPYSLAALGSVRSTPASYLQLLNRFDLIGLHNLVAPAVRLIGAAIALVAGWGLSGFIVIWLTAAVAEFVVLWGIGLWQAHRHLGPDFLAPEPGSSVTENPGIWRFMIASNADVTLSELAGRIGPLIVGWVLGPAMAGIFSVAQRGMAVVAQPAQILGNTAYAEWARLVAAGNGGAPLRRALVKVIGLAMLAALPIVAIVAAFPAKIVTLIAGPAFVAAAPVMVVLIVARTISLAAAPCSSALSAMGRPGWSMTANLFASLIFLPALPPLLHVFGLCGAGIQAAGQAIIASALLIGLTWKRSLAH